MWWTSHPPFFRDGSHPEKKGAKKRGILLFYTDGPRSPFFKATLEKMRDPPFFPFFCGLRLQGMFLSLSEGALTFKGSARGIWTKGAVNPPVFGIPSFGIPAFGILRAGFRQNGFFADFYFWAAGFFRGFSRRIFSPHFCGKKCPEKSSGKIPGKILQKLYNKNPPTHFCRLARARIPIFGIPDFGILGFRISVLGRVPVWGFPYLRRIPAFGIPTVRNPCFRNSYNQKNSRRLELSIS